MKLNPVLYILLTCQLFIASCATLYDHYTFTETIEAKLQANSLIERSNMPYADHRAEVEAFRNKLEKMAIYEKAKSKNPVTIKMWEYVNNPTTSVHKFLDLWEEKGTLSPVFSSEFSAQIEHLFDLMINYETKKSKASENALIQLFQTQ